MASAVRSWVVETALVAAIAVWFVLSVADTRRPPIAQGGGVPTSSADRTALGRPQRLSGRAASAAEVRAVKRWTDHAERSDGDELLASALSAEDPLVVGNAMRALARLGRFDDERLLGLIDDPRPRVRQELILALGDARLLGSVALLVGRYGGADESIRPLIVRSLGSIGGDEARRFLCTIRDDPSATPLERELAAVGLRHER